MIYVLEGPDGVGKSTLAAAIAKEVNGQVLHLTFNKRWPAEQYHRIFIQTAQALDDAGVSVILDRWAPSEEVYGNVFRDGPGFNTHGLIQKYGDGIIWIYCRNDNAVENHFKHVKTRNEMFDDMTKVVQEFDKYIQESGLDWLMYDYNKVDMNEFVKELPK